MKLKNTIFLLGILSLALPAMGQYRPPELKGERQLQEPPEILRNVRIDQKLDNQVPLSVPFVDENGKTVTFKDYTDKGRPIILSLVYYGCPSLCGQILNGLTSSLRMLPMEPGKDFEVVTLSFDPTETPELAAEKKANYLKVYRKPEAAGHWHWLTGEEENIKKITNAVGFHYEWDEKSKEYAHASAVFLLTPDGKVSRYFFGAEYSPKDMRLGLTEASDGKIGGPVEKFMLLCYHYDATLGKYSATVMTLIKIGGIITLLSLGAFMFFMFRQDMKKKIKVENGHEVSS